MLGLSLPPCRKSLTKSQKADFSLAVRKINVNNVKNNISRGGGGGGGWDVGKWWLISGEEWEPSCGGGFSGMAGWIPSMASQWARSDGPCKIKFNIYRRYPVPNVFEKVLVSFEKKHEHDLLKFLLRGHHEKTKISKCKINPYPK